MKKLFGVKVYNISRLVFVFSAFLLGFLPFKAKAENSNKQSDSPENKFIPGITESLDIYLLIGQSNMAGRAPIEDQDKDSLENVYLFNGIEGNEWEKATNPLNKYSTIRKDLKMQKLGPGYSFGYAMVNTRNGKNVGLVVNAKGGTPIELWAPGEVLYNEAVKQVQKAMKFGDLKGIIWHQGESNSSKYRKYMPKIKALIKALRKDLNSPDLPFIAGQLSYGKQKRSNFNKMIVKLPNKVKNTAVVKTENLSSIDSTHFDSRSQRILGERYAAKMLKLILAE